jgi:hypothetical protein
MSFGCEHRTGNNHKLGTDQGFLATRTGQPYGCEIRPEDAAS